MHYTKNDLANIIAIAEQDEVHSEIASNLTKRAQKALAYRDCSLHLTKKDQFFWHSITMLIWMPMPKKHWTKY